MTAMDFNILFEGKEPISPRKISRYINNFGESYTQTVRKIIRETNSSKINKKIFIQNSASILNNWGMARSGPYKGLRISSSGDVKGPRNRLEGCWDKIKNDITSLRNLLNTKNLNPRSRTLILLNKSSTEEVVNKIWIAFKKLLPLTMGKSSYGLVGASKILFGVFPEIVLPVDNAQWLTVFKTVDIGDVINTMMQEIKNWEKMTGKQLQNCDFSEHTTLPAVYNVMALAAR